jgi:DNA-binding MarR family transcriptional regulator
MNDAGHYVVANRVWFRLLRLQARLNLAISERLRAIGVSVPQCDVLTTLTEREGLTQQELAQRLYVTKGNISGLIDRLEAAGFVERRATVGDRRSHAIFLTEAGRRIANAGIDIQRDFVEASFGRLPPDRIAALEKTLVDVRDIVREMNGQGSRAALRRR